MLRRACRGCRKPRQRSVLRTEKVGRGKSNGDDLGEKSLVLLALSFFTRQGAGCRGFLQPRRAPCVTSAGNINLATGPSTSQQKEEAE